MSEHEWTELDDDFLFWGGEYSPEFSEVLVGVKPEEASARIAKLRGNGGWDAMTLRFYADLAYDAAAGNRMAQDEDRIFSEWLRLNAERIREQIEDDYDEWVQSIAQSEGGAA